MSMGAHQRDVLKANLDSDGGEYHIVTIEYPCDIHGSLKIVTRQIESDQCDVDIYDTEGRTIEYRSFMAREYS
jgi:hypothetical protein